MDIKQNPENSGENQGIRDEMGRFKPGQSGNLNGKPLGTRNFTTRVREALAVVAEGKEYTYEEALVKTVMHKAIIDKDPAMIRLVWNYLDGMPQQNTDITSGGKPIPIYGGNSTKDE